VHKKEKIAVNDLLAIIGRREKVDVQKIVETSKIKESAPPGCTKQFKYFNCYCNKYWFGFSCHSSSLIKCDGRVKALPGKKLAQEKELIFQKSWLW